MQSRISDQALIAVIILGVVASGCLVLAQERSEETKNEQEESHVFTNDDLPGSSTTPAPVTTTAPEPVAPLPKFPIGEEVRDRNGHGKGWWIHRALYLDFAVYEAALEEQKLYVKLKRGKELEIPNLRTMIQAATVRLKELEAERDGLPEELRVAGGLPGWLRRGELEVPESLPSPPVPEPPVSGDGITFSWKAAQGASYYFLEVECSGAYNLMEGDGTIIRDVTGTGTTVHFADDCSGQWRICSLNPQGFAGDWSSWMSFTYSRQEESGSRSETAAH